MRAPASGRRAHPVPVRAGRSTSSSRRVRREADPRRAGLARGVLERQRSLGGLGRSRPAEQASPPQRRTISTSAASASSPRSRGERSRRCRRVPSASSNPLEHPEAATLRPLRGRVRACGDRPSPPRRPGRRARGPRQAPRRAGCARARTSARARRGPGAKRDDDLTELCLRAPRVARLEVQERSLDRPSHRRVQRHPSA